MQSTVHSHVRTDVIRDRTLDLHARTSSYVHGSERGGIDGVSYPGAGASTRCRPGCGERGNSSVSVVRAPFSILELEVDKGLLAGRPEQEEDIDDNGVDDDPGRTSNTFQEEFDSPRSAGEEMRDEEKENDAGLKETVGGEMSGGGGCERDIDEEEFPGGVYDVLCSRHPEEQEGIEQDDQVDRPPQPASEAFP